MPSTAIGSAGSSLLAQQPRAHRVVDVVVDVGDAVDHPHDPALQRLRQRRAAGVAGDPVAHLLGQVQARRRRAPGCSTTRSECS